MSGKKPNNTNKTKVRRIVVIIRSINLYTKGNNISKIKIEQIKCIGSI